MKNAVIILSKEGKKIVYIAPRAIEKKQELHERQHRLRLKTLLYGHFFQIYDPGMDFTNAENAGWIKELDKRNK
jgi:hypothetical protein